MKVVNIHLRELALAQASLGQQPEVRRWSPWVRFLRWLVSKGKARGQGTPEPIAK